MPVWTSPLVSLSSRLDFGIQGADQGDAAAGDDALFDGRLGGVERVFDAGLFLFHLGLGGSADVDHWATPPTSLASRSCSFSRS